VRHPERIKSLVIANTGVFMEDDVPKRIALLTLPWLGEFLVRRFNVFARAAVRMASAKGLSAGQRRGLLFPYQSYDNRLGIARFIQDIPLNPAHPTAPLVKEIAACLPRRLRCPILITWGMRDFCFHPGFLAKWCAIFPKAEVLRFEEAGHYLLEDEPTAVPTAIREFLARAAVKR
jgi:haloalkane dehalogenase